MRKALSDEALAYRLPREVTETVVLASGIAYPVCPRCRVSLDREYMNFCDRCGQRLSWQSFPKAAGI